MSGAVQIPFPPSRKFQRSNDADYLYYGIIRHLLLKRPRVAVLRTRLSPRKSPFQRAKALGNPHNSTLVRSVASQRPHQMCDMSDVTCRLTSQARKPCSARMSARRQRVPSLVGPVNIHTYTRAFISVRITRLVQKVIFSPYTS